MADTGSLFKVWRRAFEVNEVRLVCLLAFDTEKTLDILRDAQILDERLEKIFEERNLTRANKVHFVLSSIDDKGLQAYRAFYLSLCKQKQHAGYTTVSHSILQSLHQVGLEREDLDSNGCSKDSLDEKTFRRKFAKLLRIFEEDNDREEKDLGVLLQLEEEVITIRNQTLPKKERNSMLFPHNPCMINPQGVLGRSVYRKLYTGLFKMAWNGKDTNAHELVDRILKMTIPLDLKVVSLEVIHTVDWKMDLEKLQSALAMSQDVDCENKHFLSCRVLRRLAGLHFRAGNISDARSYNAQALQLAECMAADIDTVYTYRLQSLLLFEEYKTTHCQTAKRGAEVFFRRAMDHVASVEKVEWKKMVTERIKISKALFHLDSIQYSEQLDSSTSEEICQRALDTIEDVDTSFLTDGDCAFYHMVQAKIFLLSPLHKYHAGKLELEKAIEHAVKSKQLNRECGFADRTEQANSLLSELLGKRTMLNTVSTVLSCD